MLLRYAWGSASLWAWVGFIIYSRALQQTQVMLPSTVAYAAQLCACPGGGQSPK